MRAEFPTIHKSGVAWTVDELEDGLISIAAPIHSVEKGNVAAIYLSTPSFRFVKSAERKRLVQQILNTAEAINHTIANTKTSEDSTATSI